jgi:hypothetical protein
VSNTQHNGDHDGPAIPAAPGPWTSRFADLPIFSTPPGVLMPQSDGDIALLEEMREKIFEALYAGAPPVPLPYGLIQRAAAFALTERPGELFRDMRDGWPVDRAAELLAAWRETQAAAA